MTSNIEVFAGTEAGDFETDDAAGERSVAELARETGITETTLYNWLSSDT